MDNIQVSDIQSHNVGQRMGIILPTKNEAAFLLKELCSYSVWKLPINSALDIYRQMYEVCFSESQRQALRTVCTREELCHGGQTTTITT